MAFLDPIPSSSLGDISISRNAPAQVSNLNPRWHPKITVYRLFVISTTISLGSAKAAATFYGKSYVSTTIEWIAGVVVFILLFVAGWFEENPSEYPKLAWFVDRDLVRLVWSPKYSSEVRQRTDGPYPLVTSYRLLVSGSAFTFGMMKASLSYAGLGGAANVLDWILGVIITSILYVLGLYERNPVNMMPYLFETHYDNQCYSGISFFSSILPYLMGLTLAIGLSLSWGALLRLMIGLSIEIYNSIKKESPPTSFTTFHKMSTELAMGGLMWIWFLGSTVYFPSFLWKVVFGQLTPFHELTKLLRRAFLWIPKTISGHFGDFNTPAWAEGIVDLVTKLYRFVGRFGAHILIFTFSSLVLAIGVFEFLGFPVRIICEPDTYDNKGVMIFQVFISVVCGVGACVAFVNSILEVFRPFSQNLDDRSRRKLFFEN